MVAQFLTDDSHADVWNMHLARVTEEKWDDLLDEWLAWKAKHGPNYFRLGTVRKAWLMSTNHAVADLPSYEP